jgi:flagellar L-ring protein precursor FlgH
VCGIAGAQSNSLLGAGPRANNTTPPAGPPAAEAEAGLAAGVSVRASFPLEHGAPKQNAVLLQMSPFAVPKPESIKIKVHDLITIIVRESKTATTDSKLESKKNWSLDSSLDKWIRLSDAHGIVPAKLEAGKPGVLFDFKNDYKGNGKYDRKDELTTRITATVIDVKPNGTLVLEAKKSIVIDEDGYTITLTGICRGADILPDNTVLSTQMAEPAINVQHCGAVRDATRRGWIMRGLDFLHPF